MTDDPPRFKAAVEPALRVRLRRRAARVLVIDDRERLLLFEDSDPLAPGTRWWITPGGGIDRGESEIEAAVREVAEETGLTITAADLSGPVARQFVVHGFSDIVVEQDEVFFLLRVHAFDVDIAGHTEDEQLTVIQHRWWSREELAATAEWIWPARLVDLWALHDQPDRWPFDLGSQEQSTIPV